MLFETHARISLQFPCWKVGNKRTSSLHVSYFDDGCSTFAFTLTGPQDSSDVMKMTISYNFTSMINCNNNHQISFISQNVSINAYYLPKEYTYFYECTLEGLTACRCVGQQFDIHLRTVLSMTTSSWPWFNDGNVNVCNKVNPISIVVTKYDWRHCPDTICLRRSTGATERGRTDAAPVITLNIHIVDWFGGEIPFHMDENL